ncbi:MAG: VTT domain-containing protein [Firmicutes bacterium]|jgi:membrane protein YqaA with SNARE-associated domain|nr:VTT domain-containing protein [Bacillota bacterium]
MTAVIEWALDVFGRFGAAGLFVVAFAESSFFPVPPDVMLLPMCIAHPRAAVWYAAITTASSVLGAAFGYLVGARGGRPLLLRFTDEQGLRTVQRLFDRYGGWAVGIAAFTPIPYKVFTIASGIFRVRLTPFFAASIIGRGGRFFLEAILAVRYGEAFRETIGPRFETITLLVGLTAAALAIALGRARRRAGTAVGTDAVADRRFARVRLPKPVARFSRHHRNALAEWFIYLLAGFIFLLILLEEIAELAASGAMPVIHDLDTQINSAIQSIRHPVLTGALTGVAFLSSYPAVFAGLGLAVFLFMCRLGNLRRVRIAALLSCVLGSAGLAILARLTRSIPGPAAAAGLPQLLTGSAEAGGLLVSACFYGMLSIILRRHAAASLGPGLVAPILMASNAFAWVYLGLAWPSEAAAELIAAGIWLLICGWLMALVERKQLS